MHDTPGTPALAVPGKWRQFIDALNGGARLALLRRPASDPLHAPWWLIGAMALLSLASPALFNFTQFGLDGRFESWAVPGALVHLPLLALGVLLVAYLTHTVTRFAELLLGALLVFFWTDVIVYLTWLPASKAFMPRHDDAVMILYYTVAPAWPAVCATVHATRLSPKPRVIAGPALIAALLAWTAPWVAMQPDRQLWYPPQVERAEAAPEVSPADEARLYSHGELLRKHLDQLQRERPGVIDLYSVAVAGDASQDVFLREVRKVTDLMHTQFDATGRTLQLINSRHTHDNVPLASVTSVRESLRAVADRMNKDEDILLLFLTSHGSADHKFYLNNWPVKFQEFTPKVLRDMLDQSGIRHRVLIVSACYSGGFVEALKNDDTLILTAAAIDRTSFGCSNEADWTYFGKAYFEDALPRTHSFIGAFEAAKPEIEKRELAENHKPSAPQIHIGANIRAKLDAFEKQFKR
ncbi:MAG: C13 family peptidase [Burkholderiales bacterium]|nr:C13 family peptidase [Burkholderiales bacterium]